MRAISLWQPWASAVACELKSNETRSWSTKFTGPLAIHAAKRWTKDEQSFYLKHPDRLHLPNTIPLGRIVAVVELVKCVPVEEIRDQLSARELSWGDYSDGRFAWVFQNLEPLAGWPEFRGAQGFFSVPDEVFADFRSKGSA